jgi:hypothetical protein
MRLRLAMAVLSLYRDDMRMALEVMRKEDTFLKSQKKMQVFVQIVRYMALYFVDPGN